MNGLSCKTRRPGPLSGKAATEGEEGIAALETGRDGDWPLINQLLSG